MKKLLAFCLALVLLISCCACTQDTPDNHTSTDAPISSDITLSDNDVVDNDVTESDSVSNSANDNSTQTSKPSKTPTSSNKPSSSKPGNILSNIISSITSNTSSDKNDKTETTNNKQENQSSSKNCTHSYQKATCSAPKTCSKCGKEEGKALGHKYSEATCAAPKTCSVCGKKTGAPLSHTYKDATCKAPKTCSGCGKTKGNTADHKYSDATCTTPKTCLVCSATTGTTSKHNYVAGECSACGDYSASYCPKLYFNGDMSKITDPAQQNKSIECNINFEYRSSDQIVDGAAKIKIQGSSSRKWRKKNYTINFYEDSTYGSKKKINVGWGAQSKYCLKANWIDKTHSRNVVTAKLAGMMQSKYGLLTSAPNNGAIDGFPVEIYINGEFHGLYTMNIPKDEWQFGMDKDNPNHIVIGGGGWEDPVKFKAIPTKFSENGFEVEAGPENEETLKKLQRLVDFVLNSSDDDFKKNFSQYLNLDSTLNYYIMMNYAWMPDNVGKNMLLATYDGKVWYPCLYDLDTTWGTHWEGKQKYNYSSGFINGSESVLWSRFEKHFKKEIAARYFELRQDILDPNNVMNMFNKFYSSIPQEVLDRETAKWTLPNDPIPGYDFSQIQEYLNTVVPRLDTRFNGWK